MLHLSPEEIQAVDAICWEGIADIEAADPRARASLHSPVPMDIVDWMEANCFLLPEVSPTRPGLVRFDKLQKGVFRALQEPGVEWVSLQKPPRFGATVGTACALLYKACHEVVDVFYTERDAAPLQAFHDNFIAPILRESESLRHLKRPEGADKWWNSILDNGAAIQLRSAAAAATSLADAAAASAAQAETDAQAGIAAAAVNARAIAAINKQLGAAGVAGFPMSFAADGTGTPTGSSGSTSSGSSTLGSSSGSTSSTPSSGTTSSGSSGSGGSGSMTTTSSSGSPSGAQADLAKQGSTSGSTATAATRSVSSPSRYSYVVTGSAQTVAYQYTDGSALTRTWTSAYNNGDGTYAITYADGTTDTVTWTGTGTSATGTVSTGTTPAGTAYRIGTGVGSGSVLPFVEAAVSGSSDSAGNQIWEGLTSDGNHGMKSFGSSALASNGDKVVTFGDETTFRYP